MNLLFLCLYILIVLIVFDFVRKNLRLGPNDPKGPISLPLFGNLLMLGKNPHRTLTALSHVYGGVFRLYMGDHYAMVITDPYVVRQIWNKRFSNFSNRPHPNSYRNYSGDFQDLAFADYKLWKKNRQLVSSAFTKTKLKTVEDIIERQTRYLVDSMKKCSNENEYFEPKKYYSKFAINIVCGMMFSKEISPEESVDQGSMAKLTVPIQSVFKKLGADNPDDFISILSPFFYFANKKFKRQVEDIYEFMEGIYDDHVVNLDPQNPKDQMDLLIIASNGEAKFMVIHTAMDFLLAGSDSNAAVIEWFCLFLINNKDIQKKAYEELVGCLGKDSKFVSSSDRQQCEYMVSIIKEILRVRPVGPLGIPRVALESTNIETKDGESVFIPKGTQVYQNIYGLGHNYVENPHTFRPERWIEYRKLKEFKDINGIKEKDYFNDLDRVCIPYSVGNRNCPGMALSEMILFSACANILLNFELDSVSGNNLDEEEVFGLTIHPKPFSIKLTPRF
ncbi:hypothetical protein DICPUDRAFT_96856 [Dictyostelium purpureum]|uniref:Cytochrome P450 family protein n=1 Tax=Dictyostelium purpureum TaxID=5786 RepID=F0ZBR9_DICPU|nr:uncharacterized protein DICPUDRAFT_96856 [Dictyostelium purpureum]EGC38582.1 hypothetical protein DICPUDRAFT_96856 [Dictyostelium purpureum]|eukprot:XP_003284861.1 hypothetical protein DICPUDRAFT_96856 [Dictyostelium purpureum]